MNIPKKHPNWRSGIEALSTIATFLGGFSLTLMLLSLDPDTKSVDFRLFGRLFPSHASSLILLAMATVLFVYSIQCLLRAQAYDYFDIEDKLIERMEEEATELHGDIDRYIVQMESKCRVWYTWGARLFDFALLSLLGGAAALMFPYQVFVAMLFILGIVIEMLWLVLDRIIK